MKSSYFRFSAYPAIPSSECVVNNVILLYRWICVSGKLRWSECHAGQDHARTPRLPRCQYRGCPAWLFPAATAPPTTRPALTLISSLQNGNTRINELKRIQHIILNFSPTPALSLFLTVFEASVVVLNEDSRREGEETGVWMEKSH